MTRETSTFEHAHRQWQEQRSALQPEPRSTNFHVKHRVLNFGLIHSEGENISVSGVRDWTKKDSLPIDHHTMHHEASVGKVRFAGLAFLMQQEGIIDLTQNAYDFFQQDFVQKFFKQKFPQKNVHAELMKLIGSDEGKKSRLIDYLCHSGGAGNLGMVAISRRKKENGENFGIDYAHFTIVDILRIPWKGEEDIPLAQGTFNKEAEGFFGHGAYNQIARKHGEFQYSNIGYMLLAEALEAAYWHKTGTHKNYKQLTYDFIIHPREGRAAEKIDFSETKFPEDITPEDNAVTMTWYDSDRDRIVVVNHFNGHSSAVGPFSSLADQTRLFREFFRGFPETPEYGKEANIFFSDETIHTMQREWEERSVEVIPDGIEKNAYLPPAMQKKQHTPIKPGDHKYYAGPGFMIEKDSDGKIVSYHKSGFGWGLRRFMELIPQTGQINCATRIQENVSDAIAEKVGVTLETLHATYRDLEKPGGFDRGQLFRDFQEKGIEYIKDKILREKYHRPTSDLPLPRARL